jgi:hypothetical protein
LTITCPVERSCERCGRPFTARRKSARYCSPSCRTAAWSARAYRQQALEVIEQARLLAAEAGQEAQAARAEAAELRNQRDSMLRDLRGCQHDAEWHSSAEQLLAWLRDNHLRWDGHKLEQG